MWYKIPGHERFEINKQGKVRRDGKPFTPGLFGNGYPYISHVGYIHRIVAQLFIPNPEGHPFVLHKKRDRLNCKASNLYWGTQKDNMKDRRRDGMYKPRNLSDTEVMTIRALLERKVPQQKIAAMFNVTQSTISHINTRHTHK